MSSRASLLFLATLLSGGAAQAAEDELAQVSPLIITAQVGDGYLPGRLDTAFASPPT